MAKGGGDEWCAVIEGGWSREVWRVERGGASRKLAEGVEGEFADLARGKVVEGEGTEGGAVECEDLAALAGEHAADLVVAAFGERQLGGTWIEDT